jgi:hypothetical protein
MLNLHAMVDPACSKEGAGLGDIMIYVPVFLFILCSGMIAGAWLGWRKAEPGKRLRGLWQGSLYGLVAAIMLSPILAIGLVYVLVALQDLANLLRDI